MRREKSGDSHQGDLSRRDLLQRAGTFAAGSLAATVFAGVRGADDALARPLANRPQRVAIIGVGHYHAFSFPNYLQILRSQKLDIVAIHDPDPTIASRYAGQVGSVAYTDYRAMIEKTKPEFVVALGHHAAMPAAFRFLVDAGIPFLMEKPWGIDDKTVSELAGLAEKRKAWAAVPMPFRYSWWAQTARNMRLSGELGTISHMLVRFNQPGVQRYVDSGSSWMLTKAEAGGGALLNLGIHGFDVCRYITGEEPRVVSAVTSHSIHKREVEDYAFVTLRTPSGIVCLNEASYTFPSTGSDTERKIAAEKALVRATNGATDGLQIIGPGRDEVVDAPKEYVGGWPGAVVDCLDRVGRGDPPAVTARDCARAVSLTFDAYRMAGETRE
jgi:predicted dehydrogenase